MELPVSSTASLHPLPFQGRQPCLFQFLSVLEQRIQIVGNANSRIPVAEVVVQGKRTFDQDRSVEIIGGVQADAWPFLGTEKFNPVYFPAQSLRRPV